MSDALLKTIDLMQPVVMTPTLHTFQPALMAYCSHPGQVQVKLGGAVHTLDTLGAIRLLRDLRAAVENSAGWPPA